MSANGAFSTTLDFEFFAGGYTTLAGGVSATIEPSLVSYAKVPINGTLSDFNLDFTFSGIVTPPIIRASAELSFGFDATGFLEFGVIRFASSEWSNRIPFSATSEGYVTTHAYFTPTLEFALDTEIYVFSLGDSSGSYGFSLQSTGINVSTREYSRDGGNYCYFDSIDFNDVQIYTPSNGIIIMDNGIRDAEVLQK
tara:strand:+ start:4437 stop:5024 length:588 start_codon:yes stop_codon:yes gene_type:complete